jgi:hypothetical protein
VALENATVKITVIGNFGTTITLSGTGCPTDENEQPIPGNLSCTQTTDENGFVRFTVQLNKTGSYTFSVETDFPPHTLVASTNQFIVRP